ncbi:FtsQ-type POTRA domain-containing protein [Pseudoclavibacter sp. CFCC 13796]|uniref:FtsQ-type POTRA domain-containing protein n=1 Tax=Pseudoclavibacter sp. CFCC 13796 TaxID=2615179 RepID=UPI0013015CFB|nr:FtsQ-type POTRA domain-containing protein [Pseudoclavibacter sp. CFCC 13796]KAB1661893.1 FtsQ-type POTRA domain-containing protein [Pseudoclavibacter sp. CFCC 13796]
MTGDDRIRRPHLRTQEDDGPDERERTGRAGGRKSRGRATSRPREVGTSSGDAESTDWRAGLSTRWQEARTARAARAQLRATVRRRRAREREDLRAAGRLDRSGDLAGGQQRAGQGRAGTAATRASIGSLFHDLHLGRFLIIGLAVVIAVTIGLVFSPWLSVQHIEVRGTQRASAAELSDALSDQVGRPIIGLSGAQIERELQQFSAVESYSIRAELPGTLIVTVTERAPIGVFKKGDSYLLVDAAGVVVQSADQPEEGYPTLQVASTDPQSPAFSSVAAVLRSLDGDLLAQVASAQASTQDDVQLTLRSGTTVVWGDGSETELKARVLRALVGDRPDAKHIDVSSPSLPVAS